MLSRRQKSASTSTQGTQPHVLSFDPESSTCDVIKLTPPTTPPSSRPRPPRGAVPVQVPMCLRKMWNSISRTPTSDGGMLPAPRAFFTSSCDGYGSGSSTDNAGARPERRRGQPRRVNWVRFMAVVSKISLLVVVGALVFDLYLLKAAWFLGDAKRSTKTSNSHKGRDSGGDQKTAARDGSGNAKSISSHPRFPPLPQKHINKKPESIRAIWDRVEDIENKPLGADDGHGAPGAGTEREVISRSVEDERTTVNAHLTGDELGSASALYGEQLLHAAAAVDQERAVLGPNPLAAHVPRPPPRPDPNAGQRVAVVVPYVGSDLPVWWDAFTEQAKHNEGLVDWIIFCDQSLVREGGPPNIKFFSMDTRRMAWLLAGVVEQEGGVPMKEGAESSAESGTPIRGRRLETTTATGYDGDASAASYARSLQKNTLAAALAKRKRAASFLYELLINSPYYIVEFKPALGWLFREYLGGYSHWAYGDLDVLFGDMTRGWLEPDELREFDIITFSFGDQYRAYLRGQLTIHKNQFRVNRVWRGCTHLTNYAERLEAFRVNRALALESAEGCYSLAAASDASLKIKFTVKALSDVDEEGEAKATRGQEVIIDGDGLVTLCPDLGFYDGPNGARGTLGAPSSGPRNVWQLPTMQDAVGPMTRVTKADSSEGRCEHWIKPEHQTCVENIGATHTLFLLGGEYFKQEFINTAAATGGRDCRAGAFYHFQAHKVNYRTWNTRPPVPQVHNGVAAGPGGIVPVPAAGWRERTLGPRVQPHTAHRDKFQHYCLEWEERPRPRSPDKGRSEQLCTVKVSRTELVVIADTRSLPSTPGEATPAAKAQTVTLGGIGDPDGLDVFLSSAGEWVGPKIFVMVVDSESLASTRRMPILRRVKYVRGGILIAALVRPTPETSKAKGIPRFPQKALMNAVSDLCESRYLLTLPGPFRLSPKAFQAIISHLYHRGETGKTSASSTPSSPEKTAPGPVTLVIPIDASFSPTAGRESAGGGTLDTSTGSATAAAASAAVLALEAAALALDRARVTLAASKAAEKVAAKAASAAAKLTAVMQAAVDGGRLPTATLTSSGFTSSSGNDGGRRSSRRSDAAEIAPFHIAFGPATSGKDETASREHKEKSQHRQWQQQQHQHQQQHQQQHQPYAGALQQALSELPPASQNAAGLLIKDARRLGAYQSAGENVDSGGAWTEGGGSGSDSGALYDWEGSDSEDEADWLRGLFWSGAGMPGLVVDLWSPGALFIRHVEEFGDCGCMDAAYALGLWRAGSTFQVVADAKITHVDLALSSQSDLHGRTEAVSDEKHVFRVPGGNCLQSEAVARTASIYSAFLRQVGNVYRHPRSGIAGQRPTRTYKDHWDHLSAGSDTASSKSFGGGAKSNDVDSNKIDDGGRGGHDNRSKGSGGIGGGGVRGAGATERSRVSKMSPRLLNDGNTDALDRDGDGVEPSRKRGDGDRRGGWGGAWEDQA